MKRYLLFLFLSVCGMASAYAQNDVKLEAESAAYTNCKLVEDNKYSGGKALELTESNAKITFTYTASEAGKYAVLARPHQYKGRISWKNCLLEISS